MIGFKLAQEMKNAGFPQEPAIDISGIDGQYFGGFYYLSGPKSMEVAPNFLDQRAYDDYLRSPVCAVGDIVKIPQLDEIIAQLGWQFTKVERDVVKKVSDVFYVAAFRNEECIGDYADEAAALLWLRYHKK